MSGPYFDPDDQSPAYLLALVEQMKEEHVLAEAKVAKLHRRCQEAESERDRRPDIPKGTPFKNYIMDNVRHAFMLNDTGVTMRSCGFDIAKQAREVVAKVWALRALIAQADAIIMDLLNGEEPDGLDEWIDESRGPIGEWMEGEE